MKRPTPKANKWEDHYSRRARKEHFPARSVFKLKEIQEKFRLIKKGDRILDLGCSPGSWMLYASELAGERGTVTGVDIKDVEIKIPANAKICIFDILNAGDEQLALMGNDFNIVLSDMAPSTTSDRSGDAARSYDLSVAALNIAKKLLVPGGSFLCKIFQGDDFKKFSEMVKAAFYTMKIFKPQSSRKASKEIFVIGTGFRG
jgi:23S rRNA (uridine2552-2'-O)-methyltransferase